MKIKVNEATRLQLDWLVAKCEHESGHHKKRWSASANFHPTTNPAQGQPIMERERIAVDYDHDIWNAAKYGLPWYIGGPTMLMAAMRCWVASKLGDEVEVPEELK